LFSRLRGLFDRCGKSCCGGCEPTCCEAANCCEPACCEAASCCDSCNTCCKKKRCGLFANLFRGHRKSCCGGCDSCCGGHGTATPAAAGDGSPTTPPAPLADPSASKRNVSRNLVVRN
jgi:hypothetical protein